MLSDKIGKEIAEALGVRYEGIQQAYPDFFMFTDPITRTTFSGRDLESASQNLQVERIAYGKA